MTALLLCGAFCLGAITAALVMLVRFKRNVKRLIKKEYDTFNAG